MSKSLGSKPTTSRDAQGEFDVEGLLGQLARGSAFHQQPNAAKVAVMTGAVRKAAGKKTAVKQVWIFAAVGAIACLLLVGAVIYSFLSAGKQPAHLERTSPASVESRHPSSPAPPPIAPPAKAAPEVAAAPGNDGKSGLTAPVVGGSQPAADDHPKDVRDSVDDKAGDDKPRGDVAREDKPQVDVADVSEPPPDARKLETPKASAAAEPPPPGGQAAAGKHLPPSLQEQKRLLVEIDKAYTADDETMKLALARKLLEDGRRAETDPARQFVLLRRAGELAKDAGDADLMLEAIDAIVAAGFDIRPYPIKARWLIQLLAQCASVDDFVLLTVSTTCVRFAAEAAAAGAIEEASEVVEAARKALAGPIAQAQETVRATKIALAKARTPADKARWEKSLEETQVELDGIKATQSALAKCAARVQQARRDRAAGQTAL